MNFEFDGEKYRKASTHQREWGAKLIAELPFTGCERILDLGCGDGAMTAQLAELVPAGQVVGIDASRGMIETAQKYHQAANLSFKLLDINAITFKSQFDLIVSNATLHWVQDHKKLLTNVHATLKQRGFARFNFAGAGTCSHFFKVIIGVMKSSQFATYFRSFNWPWYMPEIEEYEALAKQSPFKKIKVWGENADRNFSNADAMIQWIDQPSIVPFLGCVDEKDKKAFRDQVVEQMIEATRRPDGSCFETFRRVNVLARKG